MGVAQRRAAAGLGAFEVVALEQVGGAALRVVVELVEQHQVGTHPLQHGGDLARAGVAGREARGKTAGRVVVQRDVVGGDAQRRGLGLGQGVLRVAVDVDAHAARQQGAQRAHGRDEDGQRRWRGE